ncbi:MAG: DNA methyltransferase [Patescibacteria group bacterium]
MSTKLQWRTERRKVSDLVPNPNNPRAITPKQMNDLKRSLRKFNLAEIPVINTDNHVVAGHQRLLALQLLGRGEEHISVRVPSRKLTQKEYDQYLLSSNRIGGEWDWVKLAEYFDVGDLLASGFDDIDLSNIFDDTTVEDDDFHIDEELKKIKKTSVKPGDLYQMGPHRIKCGDSTNDVTVRQLAGRKRVAAIIQDPPFNIKLSYDKGIGGKGHYGGSVDDDKPDKEYEKMLRDALINGLSVCKPDAHIFTYCDQSYVWLLQQLYKELGITYKRTCLWIKNNSTPTPNVAFNKQYEPCVYGIRGKPYLSDRVKNISEIMNQDIGTGNRTIEDILDMIDVWLVKRVAGGYEHPTEKPPSLHEKALRRCTKPGDIVLDLFSGSASLMVACDQLKRFAYLVEREPVFVQLALNRYAKLSGKKVRQLN